MNMKKPLSKENSVSSGLMEYRVLPSACFCRTSSNWSFRSVVCRQGGGQGARRVGARPLFDPKFENPVPTLSRLPCPGTSTVRELPPLCGGASVASNAMVESGLLYSAPLGGWAWFEANISRDLWGFRPFSTWRSASSSHARRQPPPASRRPPPTSTCKRAAALASSSSRDWLCTCSCMQLWLRGAGSQVRRRNHREHFQ